MWDPRESTPSWFLEWLALWALPQAVFSGCLNQPKSISLIPMYCQYIQITSLQRSNLQGTPAISNCFANLHPPCGQTEMISVHPEISTSKTHRFPKNRCHLEVVPTFAICPICPGSPICGHKWKLSPSMKNLHRLWLKRSTLPVPGLSSSVAGNSTRLVRWFCPYESFNVRPPR